MTYTTGHIYKIICRTDDKFCYIGSTLNTLKNRWQQHKRDYKTRNGNSCIHKYFDTYGVENFKMILIKDYIVCREKQRYNKHLQAYETLWINKTKSCINTILPFNPLRNNPLRFKEKIKCEVCGKTLQRYSLTNHKKNIHQKKKFFNSVPHGSTF